MLTSWVQKIVVSLLFPKTLTIKKQVTVWLKEVHVLLSVYIIVCVSLCDYTVHNTLCGTAL